MLMYFSTNLVEVKQVRLRTKLKQSTVWNEVHEKVANGKPQDQASVQAMQVKVIYLYAFACCANDRALSTIQ
jgi:hypothetical protein